MSHIDVAKRVLRRVHGVADANQGRPHRAAAVGRQVGGMLGRASGAAGRFDHDVDLRL